MGHALYDRYGNDIVCAAVSVLTINVINSIEVLSDGAEYTCDSDEEGGRISFSLKSDPSGKASLLLDSYLLGLKGIEQDYGGFLKIEK